MTDTGLCLLLGLPDVHMYVAFQPLVQVLCVTAWYADVTYYVRILDLLCMRMYVLKEVWGNVMCLRMCTVLFGYVHHCKACASYSYILCSSEVCTHVYIHVVEFGKFSEGRCGC